MHTLLIYLQTALQDQCPVIAGLLLQLDLLVRNSLALSLFQYYFGNIVILLEKNYAILKEWNLLLQVYVAFTPFCY